MNKKNKINKHQTIELITIFILTLIFNLICINLSGDEAWNYGFSYNIASGLIPYKDFNMVITPLFPILGALFMILFGKNIIIYHIFNTIICTTIFYYMKKFIPKSYYIVYIIFISISSPNYNIFCLLLLYVLMNMEQNKTNDYIIGITLGLTFITKQNIGIYLFLPSLFIKDIKRIIKRIIGFIIPILILLVYLLINNCLFEFIDYTILGVSTFGKNNLYSEPISITIVVLSIIYLVYQYKKNKDITIIYLLSFMLMVFPIIDQYHLLVAIVPIVGYFFSKLNLNKKKILITAISFISIIFAINIYDIYKGNTTYPNVTNEFKYRKMLPNEDSAIKEISNYIKNIKEDLYIIHKNAYMLKLEANIPINKYDLLYTGNLGSKGEQGIINEIDDNCSKNKCVFLVDLQVLSEESKLPYALEVTKYIIMNYHQEQRIYSLAIYKNY